MRHRNPKPGNLVFFCRRIPGQKGSRADGSFFKIPSTIGALVFENFLHTGLAKSTLKTANHGFPAFGRKRLFTPFAFGF
jgi:hypothetical protein